MRVVISGATGAIGMALVRLHVADGDQVLVLANHGSPRISRLAPFPMVEVRFAGLGEYADVEAGSSFDVFYHLAWHGGGARDDWRQNFASVLASVDAVDLAQRLGCGVFIGAGSQAECGAQSSRISGRSECQPASAFGVAKLAALHATRARSAQLGVRFQWARILSVYGPYDGERTLVTSTINKLRQSAPLAFTAGTQIWDFLYADDAARALRAMALQGVAGRTYAVGSGQGRPLREFIAEITRRFGKDSAPFLGRLSTAPGGVEYLVADTTALEQDCGWVPEISFEEGITRTIHYLATAE